MYSQDLPASTANVTALDKSRIRGGTMVLLKNGAVTAPPGAPAAARPLTSGDPFGATGVTADRGANRYGVCSIEDFPPGINDLSFTHDDAAGFYNYVKQFAAPNFWYQDGGVLS